MGKKFYKFINKQNRNVARVRNRTFVPIVHYYCTRAEFILSAINLFYYFYIFPMKNFHYTTFTKYD